MSINNSLFTKPHQVLINHFEGSTTINLKYVHGSFDERNALARKIKAAIENKE